MQEVLVKIFEHRQSNLVYTPFIYLDGKVFNDITKTEQERIFLYTAAGVYAKQYDVKDIYICWDTAFGLSYYNPQTDIYVILNTNIPANYKFNPLLRQCLLAIKPVPQQLQDFLLRILDETRYI